MRFARSLIAVTLGTVSWIAAYQIGKDAPEMRFIPAIVSGYFEKLTDHPRSREELLPLDLAEVRRIRVRTKEFPVRLLTGGNPSIRISGEAHSRLPEEDSLLKLTKRGDALDIAVNPDLFRGGGKADMTVEIFLPGGIFDGRMQIETSSGDIVAEIKTTTDVDRVLHLQSESGRVAIRVNPDLKFAFFPDTAKGAINNRVKRKDAGQTRIEAVTLTGAIDLDIAP
jgi:hypothetical protein